MPQPAAASPSTSSAALYARVSGRDVHGDPLTLEAAGLEARVLQHEIDHLDGVLILDRTVREQRKGALRALREGESYAPPGSEEDAETERRGLSALARRFTSAPRSSPRPSCGRSPVRRIGPSSSSRRPTAGRGAGANSARRRRPRRRASSAWS